MLQESFDDILRKLHWALRFGVSRLQLIGFVFAQVSQFDRAKQIATIGQ